MCYIKIMNKKFTYNKNHYHKSFEEKSLEEVMRSLIIILLVALAWRCLSNALIIWLFFFFLFTSRSDILAFCRD